MVVFNPLSGNSHLLDVVSGEVLRGLMDGPMEAAGLARKIAGFLEVDNDAETLAAAKRILANLDRLGLAEPAGLDAAGPATK